VQLRNTFGVPAAPDEAFAALLDMQRVAPCMPGAQLTSSEGDTHQGRLKLRIGPITAAYRGTVTIEDADEPTRTARLKAVGEEVGGQGAATASVTATVRPSDQGDGSTVEVVTDLEIRGKAAQFGRGALGEVTQRVLDQFARNLEATFTTTSASPDQLNPDHHGARRPSATGLPAAAEAPAADLDVLATIVRPMARTAAPVLVALLLGVLLGRISRRRQAPAWTAAPWAPPLDPRWGPPPWWPPPGGGQAPALHQPPTCSEDDRA